MKMTRPGMRETLLMMVGLCTVLSGYILYFLYVNEHALCFLFMSLRVKVHTVNEY